MKTTDLPTLTSPVRRASRLLAWLVLAGAALLAGCATGPNANPRDPFEPFNRGVTKFNDAVDEAVLKPVATAYVNATPSLVRQGVTNFFANLSDVWSAVNSVLQLHGEDAANSFLRVGVNTVMGLGGLIDIASDAGIPRRTEDFGRTLGRWGVPTGPYVVLPLLGPSTLRDTVALPVDTRGNIIHDVDDTATRNSLYVLKAVDARSKLLRASSILEEASLDKYSFTRDAVLQMRGAKLDDTDDDAEGGDHNPSSRQDLPIFRWGIKR